MKVLLRERDLSDDYIRFAAQIGADGFDIHGEKNVPGVEEKGYADAAGMRALLDRLRRWGLGVYRVAPPRHGATSWARAGASKSWTTSAAPWRPWARPACPSCPRPCTWGSTPATGGGIKGVPPRRRYTMHAVDLEVMRPQPGRAPPDLVVDPEAHFERCVRMYERLVPIAEGLDIRLIIHPSDPPLPQTEFSPLRWSRILDAVPSTHSGLLYCIGTRYSPGQHLRRHPGLRPAGRSSTPTSATSAAPSPPTAATRRWPSATGT